MYCGDSLDKVVQKIEHRVDVRSSIVETRETARRKVETKWTFNHHELVTSQESIIIIIIIITNNINAYLSC